MNDLYKELDSLIVASQRLRVINGFLRDSEGIPERERITTIKEFKYEGNEIPFMVGFKYKKGREEKPLEERCFLLATSLDDHLLLLRQNNDLFWDHCQDYS